jgi:ketosteroid isomerase-like protein
MGRISKRRTDIPSFAILSNREMVNEYFRMVTEKDVRGLLQLFDEDAVVFEPFSNIKGGLVGKTVIENFLKVVVMANEGFRRTIRFADESEDRITAIVTFERGDSVTGRFAFSFITRSNDAGVQVSKKIGTLRIQFIGDN